VTPPPQRRAGRRDGAGGHAGPLYGTHPCDRGVSTGPDGMWVMGGWDAHFSGMAAQQGRGTSNSQGRMPAETPGRCPQPKERQGKVSAMKRHALGLWNLRWPRKPRYTGASSARRCAGTRRAFHAGTARASFPTSTRTSTGYTTATPAPCWGPGASPGKPRLSQIVKTW